MDEPTKTTEPDEDITVVARDSYIFVMHDTCGARSEAWPSKVYPRTINRWWVEHLKVCSKA